MSGKNGPLYPCRKVLQRALARLALTVLFIPNANRQGWKQSEINVHRLEMAGIAGRNVVHERAMSRGLRRDDKLHPLEQSCRVNTGETTGRGRFRIAFDTDNWPAMKIRGWN